MVIWTRSAKNDLKAIFDFIARDSRAYAEKIITLLLEKADLLDNQPFMGRKGPEIKVSRTREIQVHPYRVIYEFQDETIYILAVIHARRSFQHTWKNRRS